MKETDAPENENAEVLRKAAEKHHHEDTHIVTTPHGKALHCHVCQSQITQVGKYV